MQLTYLGTAAAEGFPAVFCHCDFCNEARRLGEKNIRTRSQALVDRDILIDLPADTYAHFLQNGIEGDAIPYLLITHPHSDHLYVGELSMRAGAFAHDMRVGTLRIVCSAGVAEKIGRAPLGTEITPIAPYETVELGAYRVTALPARHTPEGECLFYLIEGERTLLYAHDTGFFFDGVFDFLQKKGVKLDLVSLDCTNVDIPISDAGSHMGFPNIERVLDRLREAGNLTDSTLVYVNHFSHNACPLHSILEMRAEQYGVHVSYDGCCVSF